MDLNWIIEKAKKCAFLIKEENFDEITSDKDYTPSAIYLLVTSTLFYIPLTIINIIGIIMNLFLLTDITLSDLFSPNLFSLGLLLRIVQIYLIVIAVTYIYAGIIHLFLKLVGGTAPFLKTIQVFIYGNTPSMLFGWIPYVGTLGGLVSLANFVIGCKRVHGISLLKAIIAVILFIIISMIKYTLILNNEFLNLLRY